MSSASSSSFRPIQGGLENYTMGSTPLGEGASGIVYPGQQIETNSNGSELVTQVAIKVIKMTPPNLDQTGIDNYQAKIAREIHVLRSISPHPGIMGFKDSFSNKDKDETVLVLEKLNGIELFDFIVQDGVLSEQIAMEIFGQIVMAVKHYQDQDITHRDLKPENIMIDPKTRQIKLVDFGMARHIPKDDSGRCTPVRTSCGSPHYVAPEVALQKEYDPKKSEVWSLGVILYAMVNGSLPFDNDHIPTLLGLVCKGKFEFYKHLDKSLRSLISQMLTVDPSQRPSLEDVINHRFCQQYKKYFVEPEIPSSAPTPISIASPTSNSFNPSPSPMSHRFAPSPDSLINQPIMEDDEKTKGYDADFEDIS